ncbi:PAS domain-containing protein [bacterium]|nr:PAS domain-containing protein [bacterium]
MIESHSKQTNEQLPQPKRRKTWVTLGLGGKGKNGMTGIHSTEPGTADLLDCAAVLLWRSDENGLYRYFNRPWLEFRGRTLEEEKGLGWIEGIHPDDLKNALDIHVKASVKQEPFDRTFRLEEKDGHYHWMKDSACPVFVDGIFAGYCGSMIDFTAEKTLEEELKRTVEEKETLLKEIHHRVKNNLQILISLLSLQRQHNDDEAVQSILQDCQNRVQVIVLLDQKLFQDRQSDGLNFAEYVKELTQAMLDQYNGDRRTISLRFEIENQQLHPDKVLPCGLILNELLTNAVKHAFPGQDHGDVTVRFYADGQDYCLEIADGGIGLSENIPIEGSKTLGLKLVSTLARQLGGELSIKRSSGTIARVCFPR